VVLHNAGFDLRHDRSRGSPALLQFLVEEFLGALVGDSSGAYNAVVCALRHACLAHPFGELEHRENDNSPGADWPAFAKKLRRLLGHTIRLWRRRGQWSEGTQASRRRLEMRLEQRIAAPWNNAHAKREVPKVLRDLPTVSWFWSVSLSSMLGR